MNILRHVENTVNLAVFASLWAQQSPQIREGGEI